MRLTVTIFRHDPTHHIASAMLDGTSDLAPSTSPNINSLANNAKLKLGDGKRRGVRLPGSGATRKEPSGLWHDIKTMRWMREPGSYLSDFPRLPQCLIFFPNSIIIEASVDPFGSVWQL